MGISIETAYNDPASDAELKLELFASFDSVGDDMIAIFTVILGTVDSDEAIATGAGETVKEASADIYRIAKRIGLTESLLTEKIDRVSNFLRRHRYELEV